MPKGIGPGFYSAKICSVVTFQLTVFCPITAVMRFFLEKKQKYIETNATQVRLI